MDADLIIPLASSAAQALVDAATTDAWQAIRSGFLRLIGRGDPQRDQVAAHRLDDTAAQLEQADEEHQEQVREALLATWCTRLADLLEERPDVAEDLRNLVQQAAETFPVGLPRSGQAVGSGAVFMANRSGVNFANTGVTGDIRLNVEGRGPTS
ncbi:hypothetical protein ACFVUY_08350 [Kitasatospora sp. NPDC058063]|uniref:hypothetical protein n=1 Tax=unclassified Kitasatospora TaxID=2633591 RepID=UPI0036DB0F61